ncbi:MAG: tyrosine-type recombinase/integrase [Deltaproteobacteria bacterium]|nr:tyrosine-type recombinase/integrase [Deltaproteobacteria bacterium]
MGNLQSIDRSANHSEEQARWWSAALRFRGELIWTGGEELLRHPISPVLRSRVSQAQWAKGGLTSRRRAWLGLGGLGVEVEVTGCGDDRLENAFDSLGFEPTIIVASAGKLQAPIVFEEPLPIDSANLQVVALHGSFVERDVCARSSASAALIPRLTARRTQISRVKFRVSWTSYRIRRVGTDKGSPIRQERKASTGLTRACERAGIEPIGWHVLRHTYASRLVTRGVPMNVVQELLRHAEIRETMPHAHLAPNAKRGAVKVLDEGEEKFGHQLRTGAQESN